MRFARVTKFAIEFAVSGGLVVVLSSSASAADSGLGTTHQKNTPAQNTAGQVEQTSAGSVAGPASLGSNDLIPASDKPAPVAQSTPGKAVGVDPQVPATSSVDSSRSTLRQVAVDAGLVSGGASVSSDESVGTDVQREASDGVAAPDAVVAPVIAVVTPEPQRGGGESAKVARTTVLRIQPMITNRGAVLAGDLAAAVPSVTLPARAPHPAQPDGLWSRLRAELAGTVVPRQFSPHGGTVVRFVSDLSVITTMVAIVVIGFMFSYGLWLRRGGFANAARSDSPVLAFSSFATLFSLSFARASAPTRSSFFDVFSADSAYVDVSSP